MSSQDALRIIEKHGLKKNHVAAKCRIPVTNFSDYLNNKRCITTEQEQRLQTYLSKYETLEI